MSSHPPSGNPVSAPGVPPIQVQTPPPPTWMAGYGPAGLHLPLLAGWGGNDKLAIDKGGIYLKRLRITGIDR